MLTTIAGDEYVVELQGGIEESFSMENGFLAFADGTLLSTKVEDGIRKFRRVSKGTMYYECAKAPDASDTVELEGTPGWVVAGEHYGRE